MKPLIYITTFGYGHAEIDEQEFKNRMGMKGNPSFAAAWTASAIAKRSLEVPDFEGCKDKLKTICGKYGNVDEINAYFGEDILGDLRRCLIVLIPFSILGEAKYEAFRELVDRKYEACTGKLSD